MNVLMIAAILVPTIAGILVSCLKLNRKSLLFFTGAALLVTALISTPLIFGKETGTFLLFSMTEKLNVSLRVDGISKIFLAIACYGFPAAGFFAFRYMEHEEKEGSFKESTFYSFYLLTLAALIGMDLSANLVAMYFFFEMITLLSMPLVLFERSKESIAAALKYLFYSIAGAFLALGAIFVLAAYTTTLDFTPGGNLDTSLTAGHETLIFIMVLLGVMGFSAKAGMYPLHGWLPTAHPAAPAPASAVLSGIIAKAGVLAVIRLIYYSLGASFISGSWVQITLLSLSLLTVFMGSMMAYRENNLKKRLAYSSISQISYAQFGIFLLTPAGLEGGLLQVLFHAAAKMCLFLTAGSLIYNKNLRRVEDMKGIGRVMPWTMGAFTLAGLSLIGIPPFGGFVSKWVLADGALNSGISVLSWLGPVILLISALLTAGYLLPVTIAGFFPGKDYKTKERSREGGVLMILPMLILGVLTIVLGIFSGSISSFIEKVVSVLF